MEKLSALDVNKRLLGDMTTLEDMRTILDEGDPEEVPLALRICTQLAFYEKNARWIHHEVAGVLESKFSASCPDAELRSGADQLRWVVQQRVGENSLIFSSRKIPIFFPLRNFSKTHLLLFVKYSIV